MSEPESAVGAFAPVPQAAVLRDIPIESKITIEIELPTGPRMRVYAVVGELALHRVLTAIEPNADHRPLRLV
jgi:hypothetical protein